MATSFPFVWNRINVGFIGWRDPIRSAWIFYMEKALEGLEIVLCANFAPSERREIKDHRKTRSKQIKSIFLCTLLMWIRMFIDGMQMFVVDFVDWLGTCGERVVFVFSLTGFPFWCLLYTNFVIQYTSLLGFL